jgi:hypothetical protein
LLRSEVSKDRQQTLADAWAQVVIDSRIMADMAKKASNCQAISNFRIANDYRRKLQLKK